MKSDNFLIGISVLFLLLAVIASILWWADLPNSGKIAFFAFGFGAGVATGARIARRRQ